MKPTTYFIIDAESIGLRGEAFWIGAVLADQAGNTIREIMIGCLPDTADGTDADREWVRDNVPFVAAEHASELTPRHVRDAFWAEWLAVKAEYGAAVAMVADVPYPVETGLLERCIADDPSRAAQAPYPLLDVASVRLAAGFDPTGTVTRQPDELPMHNPFMDARQSARLLFEAFATIGAQ